MNDREKALEVLEHDIKLALTYIHGVAINIQDEVLTEAADKIEAALQSVVPEVTGDTSDGYHTFDELYEHRSVLFVALCNAYSGISWKANYHADGTMYDNYFIAGIRTPKGCATYHLHESYWFDLDVEEFENAPEWDGHTSEDVLKRIKELQPPATSADDVSVSSEDGVPSVPVDTQGGDNISQELAEALAHFKDAYETGASCMAEANEEATKVLEKWGFIQ